MESITRKGHMGDLERGKVTETGIFPAILASQGEAADGHIVRVGGIVAEESIPMHTDHNHTVEGLVGSWRDYSVAADDEGVPVWRAMGRINLTGGDTLRQEIRHDIAHLIESGDLNGVSLHAIKGSSPTATVQRARLPKDHPYHAPRGVFFDESVAKEGSIVPLGSDTRAVIGRAQESQGLKREFFQRWAEGEDPDAMAGVEFDSPQPYLERLAKVAQACRAFGAEEADMLNAVAAPDALELEVVDFDGARLFLPPKAAEVARSWEKLSSSVSAAFPAEDYDGLEAISVGGSPKSVERAASESTQVETTAPERAPQEAERLTEEDVQRLLRNGLSAVKTEIQIVTRRLLADAMGRTR